jgi:hypothetical protein
MKKSYQEMKIEGSLIIFYVIAVAFTVLPIMVEMPNDFNSFDFFAFAQTDFANLTIMNTTETGPMISSSEETVPALSPAQPPS